MPVPGAAKSTWWNMQTRSIAAKNVLMKGKGKGQEHTMLINGNCTRNSHWAPLTLERKGTLTLKGS